MGEIKERLIPVQMTAIASEGEDSNVYRFSVASEYPVKGWYEEEILLHTPEAINLERLPGMLFAWEHNRDPVVGSEPLGKVLSWDIADKQSVIGMRWANTELSKKYRQLVDDGILTNVSIRYSQDAYVESDETCVITRWTPIHVSLVSDPADPSVGYGRSYKSTLERSETAPSGSAETVEPPAEPTPEQPANVIPEGAMDDQEKEIQSTPPVDTSKMLADIREQETTRVRSISAMGQQHGMTELANQLIEGGKSVEEARAVVSRELESRNNQQPLSRSQPQAHIPGFGKKENSRYSLMTAIRSICPGFGEYQQNCFEREVSQEIGKKIGRTTAGVFVPVSHLTVGDRRYSDRNTLATSGTPSNLIQTDLREQDFIEALRNTAKVFQLGARFMTGLMGPVEIPKQTGVSTAYWVGENQVIPESDLQFGQIGMSQKTVVSRVSMTRNLLMQSSVSVENIVREDMVREIALAIDKAAFSGSGIGAEPRGILNYAINSVPLGADGAAPTYASLVAMCSEIENDNADISTLKFLTNTRVKSKLMLTPMQASGVEGNFVLKEGASTLMGYSFNVSNQIPSNLTKGNGSSLSAIILGCWDQLIVGEWGVLEILPNVYGKTYETGGVEIRAIKSLDMCLRHEQSFAAITDAVTTL